MSLDERLRAGLQAEEIDPMIEPALGNVLGRARGMRRRRRLVQIVAAGVSVVVVLFVASIVRTGGIGGFIDDRDGAPMSRVFVSEGVSDGRLVRVFARDGNPPCVIVEGLGAPVRYCTGNGLSPDNLLLWWTHEFGPDLTLVMGFAPPATARVTGTIGDVPVDAGAVDVEGASVAAFAFFVERGDVETADRRLAPRDAAGRAVEVPRCGPDQYTPRMRIAGQTRGSEVTSLELLVSIEGFRGPRPCRLLAVATLHLERSGQRLALEGPLRLTNQQIPFSSTSGFGWSWRNWCDDASPLDAIVQIEGGATLRERLDRLPSCFEPGKPSVVDRM